MLPALLLPLPDGPPQVHLTICTEQDEPTAQLK
jgi:hypothetical protein